MRRPQRPGEEKSSDDKEPPGGRARERLRDFERARGLPTQTPADADDQRGDSSREPSEPNKKTDN